MSAAWLRNCARGLAWVFECRKLLAEADGDMEAAIEALRKSSGMKAARA